MTMATKVNLRGEWSSLASPTAHFSHIHTASNAIHTASNALRKPQW